MLFACKNRFFDGEAHILMYLKLNALNLQTNPHIRVVDIVIHQSPSQKYTPAQIEINKNTKEGV